MIKASGDNMAHLCASSIGGIHESKSGRIDPAIFVMHAGNEGSQIEIALLFLNAEPKPADIFMHPLDNSNGSETFPLATDITIELLFRTNIRIKATHRLQAVLQSFYAGAKFDRVDRQPPSRVLKLLESTIRDLR